MNPHFKTLVGFILRGLILFTTFNFFGIFIYKTLKLDHESLLTGFLILVISILIFYGYIYFVDNKTNYEKMINPERF